METLTLNPLSWHLPRSGAVPARALLALLLCISNLVASAAEERIEHPESEIEAAFLYKFLDFVQWPPGAFASPTAPLAFGVVGADEVAARLQQIVPGRAVQGHPVVIRSMSYGESLEGLQALYIGRSDNVKLDSLAQRAQQLSILTVSEAADGIDYGYVINFLFDEGRVRFDVSMEAAQLSRLTLSSRLLTVAHRVKSGAK
ncbi:MAG: hypothetical protein JWN23_1173 [Rhodocyclales bacterium]|nr:hypothetical protein [Rhodocyclales bacterium]